MMISVFGRTYMNIGAGTVGICMSNAAIYRLMMVFWSSTSQKLNGMCANSVNKFTGIEDCDGCGGRRRFNQGRSRHLKSSICSCLCCFAAMMALAQEHEFLC
ncbi:hypothetical protein GOP47_0007832 [Adiantum capillus-veneris]|uniref:Uncharacterized protein n=1 Tax=Adiantum capillus-veneris TaxID=13818 RepID=A0A9D4ZJL9_ADICA|nr:hypothetical protein GOP47_0007832 [Adiantum capillus-veneris]